MRFLRLVEISRPISWILCVILFLIGITLSNTNMGFISLLEMIMLTFPFTLFLFGINDIYDYESDKLNPRKKKFFGTFVRKNELPRIKNSCFLCIVPLIFVSFFTKNIWNIIAMISLLFFSYAYSAPLLRLKEIPIVESISNAIIIYLIVMLGFTFNALPWQLTLKAYYLLIFIIAYHIFTTIMDYESDKKVGHRTFAVRFGKRTAAFTSVLIGLFVYIFGRFESIEINLLILFSTLFFAVTFIYTKFTKIGFYLSVIIGIIAGFVYLL